MESLYEEGDENDNLSSILSVVGENLRENAPQSFKYLELSAKLQKGNPRFFERLIDEIDNECEKIDKIEAVAIRKNKLADILKDADLKDSRGVLKFKEDIENIYPKSELDAGHLRYETAKNYQRIPIQPVEVNFWEVDGLSGVVDTLQEMTLDSLKKMQENVRNGNMSSLDERRVFEHTAMYESLNDWKNVDNVENIFLGGGVTKTAINALREVMIRGEYDGHRRGYGSLKEIAEKLNIKHMKNKRLDSVSEINDIVKSLSNEQIQEAAELMMAKVNKANTKKPGM